MKGMSAVIQDMSEMIPLNGKLEAYKVRKWKNNEAYTEPLKLTVEADSRLPEELKQDMKDAPAEEILEIYEANNIKVILLDEESFQTLSRTMTAHQMVETAWNICQREGWTFDFYHLRAALANLEMN